MTPQPEKISNESANVVERQMTDGKINEQSFYGVADGSLVVCLERANTHGIEFHTA